MTSWTDTALCRRVCTKNTENAWAHQFRQCSCKCPNKTYPEARAALDTAAQVGFDVWIPWNTWAQAVDRQPIVAYLAGAGNAYDRRKLLSIQYVEYASGGPAVRSSKLKGRLQSAKEAREQAREEFEQLKDATGL